MLKHKIKALLNLKNKKAKDFSEALGLSSPQALNKKYERNSFFTSDLIQLAEFTNTELCFIDKQTGEIVMKLTPEDIKKDTE